MHVKVIAEGGINLNGALATAKCLIDTAVIAGCDYIKWQKRTPDLCVPEEQKSKPKSTPWGDMTYIDYKHRVEFGESEYKELIDHCGDRIKCFASVWDKPSVDFMKLLSDITKIPSALITDLDL